MGTKKKIMAAIIGVEAVIIAAAVGFLFYINSDTVRVNRQLELAQRYLLEEDYEQAIAAFEIVIETDPKNAEAYLGLAEAYEATDDMENMVKILERGSRRTDSDEIRELLEEHKEEIEKKELAAQRAAEAAQVAADASQVNSNFEENAVEVLSTQALIERGEEDSETYKKNLDTASNAIDAYKKFLSTSKIKWSDHSYDSDSFSFMIVDINLDGIPELFLKANANISHYEGYEAVYYYYNQQVVEIEKSDSIGEYYPETGIVAVYYFGMGGSVSLHQIPKNGMAYMIGRADSYDDPEQEAYYEWDGKVVTESEFKNHTAVMDKIEVNESDWISNTAENREHMGEYLENSNNFK